MATPVLSLNKVGKFYGPKLVFRNVTFDIHAGEAVIVGGSNGAGKTTLLRIMTGLSDASAGECVCSLPPEKVAYLGHATFIYPQMTALQNLKFWGRMYDVPVGTDILEGILKRVGLLFAAHERAGSFSRGMAQRLNLARIFLVKPELVFLDEPGTGLDAASLNLLRREITAMHDEGTTIIWVSHQLDEDRALVDRVIYLKNNTLEWQGAASEFSMDIAMDTIGENAGC
ncbi:MAG: ABC transporter ATP-binding protein [Desulfovibrio sp.]